MDNITKYGGVFLNEGWEEVEVYYCKKARHKFDIHADPTLLSSQESDWLKKLEADVCPFCA